jgi:hypothetical protein
MRDIIIINILIFNSAYLTTTRSPGENLKGNIRRKRFLLCVAGDLHLWKINDASRFLITKRLKDLNYSKNSSLN